MHSDEDAAAFSATNLTRSLLLPMGDVRVRNVDALVRAARAAVGRAEQPGARALARQASEASARWWTDEVARMIKSLR